MIFGNETKNKLIALAIGKRSKKLPNTEFHIHIPKVCLNNNPIPYSMRSIVPTYTTLIRSACID